MKTLHGAVGLLVANDSLAVGGEYGRAAKLFAERIDCGQREQRIFFRLLKLLPKPDFRSRRNWRRKCTSHSCILQNNIGQVVIMMKIILLNLEFID